ncbi:MAG: hypothetical protein PUB21_07890 [Bacteroidales bacterium]|nr:hypothetical protein [Bacteroidales bacterium]
MLIDTTYFKGELFIKDLSLGAGVPSETRDDIQKDLYAFIEQYEPVYLKNMFGPDMSVPLSDYIRQRDSISDKVEKWENIIALLMEGGYSPIAGYVYFYYVRSHQAVATPNGTAREIDSSAFAGSNLKMIVAWNSMVRRNREIAAWMREHSSDYPEWDVCCFMLEKMNEFGV